METVKVSPYFAQEPVVKSPYFKQVRQDVIIIGKWGMRRHRRERWRRLRDPVARYSRYASSAKRRNKEFFLSKEDTIRLFKLPCSYCGEDPSHTGVLNGIDRMDNDRGYVPENAVPCCAVCNFAKGKLPARDFIRQCIRVSEHWKDSIVGL